MLVQERSSPKPLKQQLRAYPDRFSEPKRLDFSTWVSVNFWKIVAFIVLVATVAALFFLNNVGNSTALLQSGAKELEKIPYPKINWNEVRVIKDKSTPYAAFRSKQWIVVSVSNYPTDSLRNLVKIRGWQVLAIGNSKTPSDWNLKGAIFLSLEQQAQLGFRVVDHLPYDSYVRKTVGYLFAIQHGVGMYLLSPESDNRIGVVCNSDAAGCCVGKELAKHPLTLHWTCPAGWFRYFVMEVTLMPSKVDCASI